MARRDLSNLRSVTEVQAVIPDQTMGAIASIGKKIVDDQIDAQFSEKMSEAQLKLNAVNAQYQIDYEGNPMGGLKELAEARKQIFQEYGGQISPLRGMQWQQATQELSARSDMAIQSWGLKQSQVNTKTALLSQIKNNMTMANQNGRQFGKDGGDLESLLNYDTARQQLEASISGKIGSETANELLVDFEKDYLKSFLSGVAYTNTGQASQILDKAVKEGKILPYEADEFKSVISISQRAQKIKSMGETDALEGSVVDLVEDDNLDYYEKRVQIDQLELEGKISTKIASRARRVLTSQEAQDSVTNTPVLAEITTQMYDLNAMADTNSEDYLVGVQNIRDKILEAKESGNLNATDVTKLNNQLKTLSSSKTADATENIGIKFKGAQKAFDVLPPEYRGQAIRQLFYETQGQNLDKKAYQDKASNILEDMQTNLKSDVQVRLQKIQQEKNTVTDPDLQFLSEKGIDMARVKQTAANRGMSEKAVIQELRRRLAADE